MRTKSNIFLSLSLVYAFGVLLFIANNQPLKVLADTNHVVISQIQISGATANDEFIELFNPTTTSIDLSKWRLTRKTSTGSSSQNLVASLSGTIAPKSYFLITHPSSTAVNLADFEYSSSSSGMTTNNTVTLYSDAGITVVDKVGFGTAADTEGSPFAENPEASGSLVRKASASSTAQSLFTGGSEVTSGNGLDTDNNAADFVLFTTSLPRNTDTIATGPSASPTVTITPAVSITPLPTVIPTATVMPTTAPTIVPSVTPTKTPTPTVAQPSNIPTSTPTTTPTPTIKPTNTPVPSALPTPTMTPMPTNVPTPTPVIIVDNELSSNRRLVCTKSFRTIRIINMTLTLPRITCSIVRG